MSVAAGGTAPGFTMLGAPAAAMCDEDGVCEVPAARTLQANTEPGPDDA